MKEYNYNGMLLRKDEIGWQIYARIGGVDRDWVPVHPLNYQTAWRVCRAIDADPSKFESFLTGETNV